MLKSIEKLVNTGPMSSGLYWVTFVPDRGIALLPAISLMTVSSTDKKVFVPSVARSVMFLIIFISSGEIRIFTVGSSSVSAIVEYDCNV